MFNGWKRGGWERGRDGWERGRDKSGPYLLILCLIVIISPQLGLMQ